MLWWLKEVRTGTLLIGGKLIHSLSVIVGKSYGTKWKHSQRNPLVQNLAQWFYKNNQLRLNKKYGK